MKPHYFVFEILKRKVVRRFLPMLDAFKAEWTDSGDVFGRQTAGYFADKTKVGSSLNPADSDLDGNSSED